MKRILFAVALVCAFCSAASASVVSGNNVLDNTGAKLASGQWCFGSQCLTVTNGAFSGIVTSGTQTVTVTDGGSTTYLTVPNVTIVTIFSWDTFVVPSGTSISGIGTPRIACSPGAHYTQTDASSDQWVCQQINGAGVWNGITPASPVVDTVARAAAAAAQSAANTAQTTANNALPKSGGTMSNGSVLAGSTVSATCSKVLATGDTRCNTGSDFSVRSNDCLSTHTPSNQICDGTSESSPIVSQTINVPNSFDLKLPPATISCNVAPCLEANGTTGFSILGASSVMQARTFLHMTVHGPGVLLNGATGNAEVGQFTCDYTAIDGSAPSTHPEDKCVVISGGTGVSPQNLKIHDVRAIYAYDNLFDGNCASGAGACNSFSFFGTNSNVLDIKRVTGWHLGNADVSFGSGAGIHDQINADMVGCDGTADLSGQGCIYISTTNNLIIGNAWVWHVNDSSAGTNSSPSNWAGIQVESTATCAIASMDFEANHALGNTYMFFNNNSSCTVGTISSYANVWGGSSGAGSNQAYIRNAGLLTLSSVLLNNSGADTCSATGATTDAAYSAGTGGKLVLNQLLSAINAMPSGTNCSPTAVNNWGQITEAQGAITSTAQNVYSMLDGALTVDANAVHPQTIDLTNMYGTAAAAQFDPNGGIAPAFNSSGTTFAFGDIPRFNSSDGHLQNTGYNATHPIPANFVSGTVANYGVSWTPAAATVSSCTEQTVTVTGAALGGGITVTPPNPLGSHVWIGSVRVSSANTAAVSFCADSTGGTPPSGTWYFRQ